MSLEGEDIKRLLEQMLAELRKLVAKQNEIRQKLSTGITTYPRI